MSSVFKTNCNAVYSCKYHLVWRPKYCRNVLVDGVDTRLKEIIHQTAQEFRAAMIELEVMPARLPRLWTNSYFTATVGGAPLAVIKQYIEHRKGV